MIPAIPELLKLLDLDGAVVTIDAAGCQKKIAATIIDQGGDSILHLKGNQGTLHDETTTLFDQCLRDDCLRIRYATAATTNGGHGRIERRRIWATSEVNWFAQKGKCKNLRGLIRVQAKRTLNGQTSEEYRYYISSRPADNASRPLELIREHWGIENSQRLLSAVQEEKERLSCLLNSISDEAWFADTDGRFTLANPSAVREFGLSSSDGTDVAKLAASLEVHRGDGSPRPVEEAPPLRALAGEVIRGEDEIIRTPGTGQLRLRQVSSAPVRDGKGNVIGSVSVVRDTTARKRAEEAMERLAQQRQLARDAARMGWWHYAPITKIATGDSLRAYRRDKPESTRKRLHCNS